VQRRDPSKADREESCWPFTEGAPATVSKDRPRPDDDPLERTPPAKDRHAFRGLLRGMREPSVVVFGAGIAAATVVCALVLAKLKLV
jgi:hypothetical protein